MPDPTEITGTLLTHGCGKQDRAHRGHASAGECFPERHQRREAARIVGDARSFETWPAARHGDVQLGTKDGIEVGAQDHTITAGCLLTMPCPDVADVIDLHVREADLVKELGHALAACCL